MLKNGDLLNSWKEISQYLKRNVRTCIRWEKELNLPVHRIDKNSSRSKIFAYKSEIDAWLQQKTASTPTKKSFLENRKLVISLLASSLLITLIFTILYINRSKPPSDSRLSLAILPFENQSSSEYDEYFSVEIMEDIITRIMNMGELNVIPTTMNSQKYRDSDDIEKTLDLLDPDFILTGGTSKEDLNVKIKVELTRREDGKNIFSEEFIGKLEDILSIQLEIYRKIRESFDLPFDETTFMAASNSQAFDSYSKANFILKNLDKQTQNPWKLWIQGEQCHGFFTKESNDQAIQLFDQTLKIDPNYAPAYIGLARGYSNYLNFIGGHKPKWLTKAEELLKKAQSLEPDLPQYFRTLIEVYMIQEAVQFLDNEKLLQGLVQKGMEKYPNYAPLISIVGYYYFHRYGKFGNPDYLYKGMEFKEKAYMIDLSSIRNIAYTEFLMLNRDFAKALDICRISGRDDNSFNTLYQLIQIYYYTGDFSACRAAWEKINKDTLEMKLDHNFFLGMMAAQEHDSEKALKIIERINVLGQDGLMPGFNLKMASIYLGLGMKEKGFQYLDTFFNKPDTQVRYYLELKYLGLDHNFDAYKESIFDLYKKPTGEPQ